MFVPSLILYGLMAVAGAVGLVLLVVGLWPRRRGDATFCAACEYNLTGITSEKCPECGAELNKPDATVQGERVRRPVHAKFGAGLLAAVGLMLLLEFNGSVRTNLLPDVWLVADCGSTNVAVAQRAWDEVERRLNAGTLSAWGSRRLVNVALDIQTRELAGLDWNAPPNPLVSVEAGILEHLSRCYVAGELSPKQVERFLSQAFQIHLDVPPSARAGAPFRISVACAYRGGPLAYRIQTESFHIGEQDFSQIFDRGYEAGGTSMGWSHGCELQLDEPGDYAFRCSFRVSVYPALLNRSNSLAMNIDVLKLDRRHGPPSDTYTVTLEDHIHVFDEDTQTRAIVVDAPQARDQLENGLRDRFDKDDCVFRFRESSAACLDAEPHATRWSTSGIMVAWVPTELEKRCAARILLEIESNSFDIGYAFARKGTNVISFSFFPFCYDGPTPDKVQLRFVADPKIVNLQDDPDPEIWGGEIVFSDVSVEWNRQGEW